MSNRYPGRDHRWKVGDLCTCTYDSKGCGLLYRVKEVKRIGTNDPDLIVIVPILGVLTSAAGRRQRQISGWWCTPVSLVDLATMYAQFGNFIAEEARKRSGDDGTASDA